MKQQTEQIAVKQDSAFFACMSFIGIGGVIAVSVIIEALK